MEIVTDTNKTYLIYEVRAMKGQSMGIKLQETDNPEQWHLVFDQPWLRRPLFSRTTVLPDDEPPAEFWPMMKRLSREHSNFNAFPHVVPLERPGQHCWEMHISHVNVMPLLELLDTLCVPFFHHEPIASLNGIVMDLTIQQRRSVHRLVWDRRLPQVWQPLEPLIDTLKRLVRAQLAQWPQPSDATSGMVESE